MKYRKKPVVIEAFQWTGGPEQEDDPEWIIEAIKSKVAWFENAGTPDVKFMIQTLEGVHAVSYTHLHNAHIGHTADGQPYTAS